MHESKVSVSSPKALSSKIEERVASTASVVPKTTTTTDIDPKVFVLKLMSMRRTAGVEYLKKTAFKIAYSAFLETKKPKAVMAVASTSNHGPHSDNDSYFGYFSYMDGSAGGKSWAEQVAMGNSTVSRYGEDMNSGGAWAHKCVMAGYSASPSG